MNEISLDELVAELKKGTRCVLQVRHAERPKMDPDDPSFGDALAITAEGCRTALTLGEALAAFRDETTFVASPLKRTVMTAELIAVGMGIKEPKVPAFGCLGNESFYYNNALEVLDVFQAKNFFPACKHYMETGELRGFNNLYTATDHLEQWLDGQHTKQLLIASTHDCYIAAYLCARKAVPPLTPDNWVRFLDGGATFIYPDGSRRYALVRTGLSEGIVGVGGKVIRSKE